MTTLIRFHKNTKSHNLANDNSNSKSPHKSKLPRKDDIRSDSALKLLHKNKSINNNSALLHRLQRLLYHC